MDASSDRNDLGRALSIRNIYFVVKYALVVKYDYPVFSDMLLKCLTCVYELSLSPLCGQTGVEFYIVGFELQATLRV
jgi:hypothetical protein